MRKPNLSLRKTFYYWTKDFTHFKPPKGHVLIEVNEEEMLRIGDTNLILGYFEDNRNNAHWFGTVVAKNDVPLDVGDDVWFSFLSGKGAHKFIVGDSIYLSLKYDYIVLRQRDDIEMLNEHLLSVSLPPKKHDFLELEEYDHYYTKIAHAPVGSKFKPGDIVHYWMDSITELEGDRKILGENYRLLREHGILGVVKDGKETPVEGMVVVDVEPEKEKTEAGIYLPKPKKGKRFHRGTVIETTCDIPVGREVYVSKGRGYKYGDHLLFKKETVYEMDADNLLTSGYVLTTIYPSKEVINGIIIDKNTYSKNEWLAKAKVIQSTCHIPEGADIYVKESRGQAIGDYVMFKEEYVEAIGT